ncbi:MAG: gfo/Idh/MocA family oxidoreductase, partial [Verrucomicrobia bacterium]|nr:gfo/Idh/MocA family oxidoreductase [Verrucomicrobiota bacterium]
EIPAYTLPEADQGHGGAIRDFLQSLAEGKAPATPASDNIHSLAMVHAAIESAESGKKVYINQTTHN